MTLSPITRARTLALSPQGVPQSLRDLKRWIVWTGEYQPERDKLTKSPRNPHHPAVTWSINDTACWSTFDHAVAVVEDNPQQLLGIGLVLNGIDNLVAIDLDRCSDASGTPNAFARDILVRAQAEGAYIERSPSGSGFRIFLWTHERDGDWINRDVGIEVYRGSAARFVTVTGHAMEDLQCKG